MRADALGLFWEDRPVIKVKKEPPPKRQPPEPTWLSPDYLPGLDEARRFNVPVFTDQELVQAAFRREILVFDIECYENYFLAAFRSLQSMKVTFVEMQQGQTLNVAKLHWILNTFLTVGFNTLNYDLPITALALAGKDCKTLKEATNRIIQEQLRGSDVLRPFKVKSLKLDHIDLIEVAPLFASLKIYGGRMHSRRMQDLPFHPDTVLSQPQIDIVRWYCVNDLDTTIDLRNELEEQINLRASMSREYGIDLRSKSDAQIAEAVITEEIERAMGSRVQRPQIDIGTRYKYRVPPFIRYQSPLMNYALDVIRAADFVVSEHGNVGMPPQIGDLKLTIANSTYQMGIGGLHSTESSVAHLADETYTLLDRDVASYYPAIILNQRLMPAHLGEYFLEVYRRIVNRRLEAKRSGNKVVADSLKITINGSFGKFGSKYSALYSPQLVIQVTVTGQLSLLMLIERLELVGIHVVSANTDGIVIKCPRARETECEEIIKQWERDTGFETEETRYRALYSKDVNNYIALYETPIVNGDKTTYAKLKGVYAKAGLSKNPTNEICVEAVIALLAQGIPIVTTVLGCKDIRKFVSVRTVSGGAVKNGNYLGKSIRWYYGTGPEADGEMVYAKTGNRVPKSDGAIPLMDLPDELPQNVNYEWYINEAEKMLRLTGHE